MFGSIPSLIASIFEILFLIFKNIVTFFIPVYFLKKSIKDQTVFITGAGHGLGKVLAKELSKLGAIILCCDISKELCEETVEEIKNSGGSALAYIADVSKRTDMYETAEKIKKEVGTVNILINNAGIRVGNTFLDTADYNIQRVLAVNILAHMWTVKAFLPDMVDKDSGHIVTISSLAGLFGVNGLVDYSTSKFAAVGFHESIYSEMQILGKMGIKFTLICPYIINTGMFPLSNKLGLSLDPEYGARKIVESILTNKQLLIIPHIFRVLYLFKGSMPFNVQFKLGRLFGNDIFLKKEYWS
ncbi:unnamed protein product [Gordionus sp. m RMFG-2023]|uniref:epidermal retinol dehydrogenase 2-like n=1 Tax=Gordionus sp. m RMFG-2023 TaxID=3053472 RepID=UPI0030DF0952